MGSPADRGADSDRGDHLNTYDGYEDYAATKRGITRHQQPGDWLVVNRDDPDSWRTAGETDATVVPFGIDDRGEDGAWLNPEAFLWRLRGSGRALVAAGAPALAGVMDAQRSGGARRCDAGRAYILGPSGTARAFPV